MKKTFLITLYLFKLLTGTMPASANKGWAVQTKADLIANIMLAPLPVVENKVVRLFVPKISEYLLNYPQAMRKEEADRYARIAFSYVLGDSLDSFKTVQISFTTTTDTFSISYPCTQQTKTALQIVDGTPQDRQDMLGNIIPYPTLCLSNPSQKYKDRFMGFSLPSHLPNGEPLLAIQIERYSLALASVLYDYVLQRNNDIVSKVALKYSDDIDNLNAVPVAENVYLMTAMLFKEIKAYNYSPFLSDRNLATQHYSSDSVATEELAFSDKLAALMILATGCDSTYNYSPPTNGSKAKCILRYHDLKMALPLPEAKVHLRAELLSHLTSFYVFLNDPAFIDSITIQFFPYKRTVQRYSWTFPRSPLGAYSSEQDRMNDLLSILPFNSEYEIRKEGFEIFLKEWPGMTPKYDPLLYANIVAFVASDFVFKRKRRVIAVSYLSPTGDVTRVNPYDDIYSNISLIQTLIDENDR